ncbi:MAG: hypothetical protein Q4C13_02620 [Clostridia bacterium]|nr:hypothetical protein [Clostridia bacterium]
MTVLELAAALGLKAYALPDAERRVTGGYAGDLLSWVMGRAESGSVWLTIMSNPNIVAVAHLADVACVLLAEGVEPDEGVAESAGKRGVNLLGSAETAFALAARIQGLL